MPISNFDYKTKIGGNKIPPPPTHPSHRHGSSNNLLLKNATLVLITSASAKNSGQWSATSGQDSRLLPACWRDEGHWSIHSLLQQPNPITNSNGLGWGLRMEPRVLWPRPRWLQPPNIRGDTFMRLSAWGAFRRQRLCTKSRAYCCYLCNSGFFILDD